MKQISLKWRLILRKILTVFSLGAVSFVFHACYGIPMTSISGTVRNSDTDEPIPGIQVSIKDNEYYKKVLTNSNGGFLLTVHPSVVVLFEDIDGPENGEFEDKEIEWHKGDGHLDVKLDPK